MAALEVSARFFSIFLGASLYPRITSLSRVPTLHRLAHTGYKRFMDLQIFDPDTGAVTPNCEMQLLAKDGIYLLQIPRAIDHIFLTAAGRAEVLVRCSGPVGKKYNIQSGRMPPDVSFPFGTPPNLVLSHNQTVVATVEIEAGGTPGNVLVQRACTPLRPSYAADMRDEAVAAAGVADKIFFDPRATYGANNVGCTINGQNFTYPDPFPLLLPLGSITEWWVYGLPSHPLHSHTNPFQITTMPESLLCPNCSYTSYFEVGDYHDTLHTPMVTLAPNAAGQLPNITLRTQPGPYAGYGVLHCHFLQHEDAGCMKVIKYECPGYADPQPKICTNFSYPIPGTYIAPALGGAAGRKLRRWIGF